jgi:hypothetical protein
MPTLSKIRCDASTKEHYEKLKGRSTCPKKAVVAECRILVCLMYTLWAKEEEFCPDYNRDKSKSVKPETEISSPVSVEEHAKTVSKDLKSR